MEPNASSAVPDRALALFRAAGLAHGSIPDISDSFAASVVDLVTYLETATEDELHPDDAISYLTDLAVLLSRLTRFECDQLVDNVRARRAAESEARRSIVDGLPEWLDLTGAELSASVRKRPRFLPSLGPVMITRKLVVVTSPRGVDQALRQDEVLKARRRQARWEVPSEHQASRAAWVLNQARATKIGIRIVPASG